MSRSALSIRLLHTSLPHRAPLPPRTSRDVLAAGLQKSSVSEAGADGSDGSASLSAQESARAILGALSQSVPRTEVDDSRRLFRANGAAPPSSFLSTSLYPTQRPFPRAPLLGPPKKIAARLDPFHLTASSPLSHDLNPLFASAFVNPTGKIKSRSETGLTWKNQRRIGKLVRRARAMGLISRWTNQSVPGGISGKPIYQ